MNVFYRRICILILLLVSNNVLANPAKREFRGVWIHTVWNADYRKMSSLEMQEHYVDLLDQYKELGFNAVIYQVRPSADAFYISELEPWSRFLSGKQGIAPNPLWDPLEFMVEECHKRGMEIHAWFNPYRVGTREEDLVPSHLYFKKPHLFFKYANQIYFNPGEPESREHTLNIISDVVKRYDIDAVHFDDYFYPYGSQTDVIGDNVAFSKYNKSQLNKADWRRENVNILVRDINKTVKEVKPWVRFGISPFCINRVNYNKLYADILKWIDEGIVDYIAPQLYWEIGHKYADYEKMLDWWSSNIKGCQLYIGQNIESTVKIKTPKGIVSQMSEKMNLVKNNDKVQGNIWWPGYYIPKNMDNFNDSLRTYYKYVAIPHQYKYLDSIPPASVMMINILPLGDEKVLNWNKSKDNSGDNATYYGVYEFEISENVDLSNPMNLVCIQKDNMFTLDVKKQGKYKYVVTALDRFYNESSIGRVVFYR